MSYLETVEKIWNLLKPLSRYRQSLHFAYWIVPGIICIFWYTAVETNDLNTNITVVPLKSTISQSKEVLPKKGFLIITNGLKENFKVPLKENNVSSQIWTSLEDSALKLNNDRISLSNNDSILKLNMPLYADNNILGIVIEGEPKGELSMPGKSISLNKLFPVSNISLWLVLSVFCSVAFGFGLIFNDFSKGY